MFIALIQIKSGFKNLAFEEELGFFDWPLESQTVISVCMCLVFVMLSCAALWSPAGKGLTSWLSFVKISLSHWCPWSGVVLDSIDS